MKPDNKIEFRQAVYKKLLKRQKILQEATIKVHTHWPTGGLNISILASPKYELINKLQSWHIELNLWK